ncbi:hypothetical protein ACUHMQ_17310 [Chitinimonas sp. PSY-7]|uniref:hypothetical protein n=1 Tax=Chitinimonas sp. PSY-7 TaxID=3459088 RepID=UPI00403FF877
MEDEVTDRFTARDACGNCYTVIEITTTISFAPIGDVIRKRKAGVRYELENGQTLVQLTSNQFHIRGTSILIGRIL